MKNQDLPDDMPPMPAGSLAASCGACARSGVGVCDDYPNCPAGQAQQR